MGNTPDVIVAVIVTNGGTLLLGQDVGTKLWTLPKGGILKFQGIQDAAQKAVFDTTGISVQVPGSIFVAEEFVPPDRHDIIIATLGKPLGDGSTLVPKPNPEAFSEVRWVDFRNLGEYQETVDNMTADAIMKFGIYLQQKTQGHRG
jgi:ADP-ribose pyrophosphatase YjhB (NUDIX family)